MDSLIVGVAIGLVFVFAVLAALTSALTEAVARFLGLRGDFLLRGIRALVDGQVDGPPKREVVARIEPATPPATPAVRGATATGQPNSEPRSLMDDLLRNALFASQGQQGLMPSNTAMLSWKQKRRLPGYLSSRTFARAVISYLVPDASGKTSADRTGDRWVDVRFVLVEPDEHGGQRGGPVTRTSKRCSATGSADDHGRASRSRQVALPGLSARTTRTSGTP
jgi:hypothetical protein